MGPYPIAGPRGFRSSRADGGPQVLPPARVTVPPWRHASTMIQWRRTNPQPAFSATNAYKTSRAENAKKPRTHRVARTILHRHGHQNAGRYHDGTELPTDGTRCSGQGSA